MIMPAFQKFEKEASIIGRLLVGYADLEIDLLNCVSMARNDFDGALKAMFRVRSSSQRIDIADALARQLYRKCELVSDFECAIGDMRYCLKIRNQYAHCNWYDDGSGQLAFINVEDLAKKNQYVSGFDNLRRHYVDVATLASQEQFFGYTIAQLIYVNFEGCHRRGELPNRIYEKPPTMERPLAHTPR